MYISKNEVNIERNEVNIGYIKINLNSGLIKHQKPNFKIERMGKRELNALNVLLHNENDVVSKITLIDSVWKDRVVTESSLNVAIFNLRKLLDKYDENNHYSLVNVSGYGYGLYSNILS
ncbi:winged helix-turn-helix domain-containing protein [Moritella sp. JT01]|uniref:winged helix-turn-helix domain-containing protein n=1 Tax=Moritella sp. JT01 TaxID=756698 RepID=UPI0008311E85|nr:winged helix-turn-helix domain-containing protein [Moritella sp. JT01]